jgi:hypothetical protein
LSLSNRDGVSKYEDAQVASHVLLLLHACADNAYNDFTVGMALFRSFTAACSFSPNNAFEASFMDRTIEQRASLFTKLLPPVFLSNSFNPPLSHDQSITLETSFFQTFIRQIITMAPARQSAAQRDYSAVASGVSKASRWKIGRRNRRPRGLANGGKHAIVTESYKPYFIFPSL